MRPLPLRIRRAQRFTTVLAGLILVSLATVSMAACTQVPDPEQNIESLEAVGDNTERPLAAEQYDIQLHPDPIVEPHEPCTRFLVITARGTGEPPNGQLLGPVSRTIASALNDVEVIDLDYAADTDINEGGTFGVRLLLDTLNVQALQCPEQRFILLGYSQGALVIGDALSQSELRLVGPTVGALSDDAAERIVAVVLFGNPRFNAEEQYNAGNYSESLSGILPRPHGSLNEFEDRIRDYCVAGDFICQNSLELNEDGHVQYFDNGMQEVGAEFAITLSRSTIPSETKENANAEPGEGAR